MRNFMFTLILLLGSACSYDKPRVQVGLWAAVTNREGDLVCKVLITSQISPDSILQKTK